jgi:hypothetical protein
MSPETQHYGIDLQDEVVRGSIVTLNGEIMPPVPRPAPPPPPPKAAGKETKEAVVALTPWQKTTRDVAVVTAGMGTALALGKATGPLFMSNMFTFALAGLIGYRVVWGVVPALHSPLMSVTNAISGLRVRHLVDAAANTLPTRYGRHRRLFRHGWRTFTTNVPPSPGCAVRPLSICERIWRVCNY